VRRFLISVTVAIAAAASVAGTSVVVAAPAGATTTDVDTWTVGFCNALEGWQTSATKVRDIVQGVVNDGVTSAAKAKALRTRIVSGFGAASKGAARASDEIDELGDPDVRGGARIRATLASAIAETGTAFDHARAAAAKASTDPAKFQKAMRAIYQQVDADLAEAGQRIQAIEALNSGGELDTAIDTEPSCDFLNGT
jgi:hypothetical protein